MEKMDVIYPQSKIKRLKPNQYKTQEMKRNLYIPYYTSNVYKTRCFPITCQNVVSANQLVTLNGSCIHELVDNYPINNLTKQ